MFFRPQYTHSVALAARNAVGTRDNNNKNRRCGVVVKFSLTTATPPDAGKGNALFFYHYFIILLRIYCSSTLAHTLVSGPMLLLLKACACGCVCAVLSPRTMPDLAGNQTERAGAGGRDVINNIRAISFAADAVAGPPSRGPQPSVADGA